MGVEYLVGVAVGLGVCVFGTISRFDRGGSFYPTILIVTASYYVLFAVLGASNSTLAAECVVLAVFLVMAVAGFKYSPWWIVAGLLAHGVFDLVRHGLILNPGIPDRWPGFCLAFDVIVALYLTGLIVNSSRRNIEASQH